MDKEVLRQHLNTYYRLRFSIIPIKTDGSKLPEIPWKEYQKRLPTKEELREWFGNFDKNVAIITGPVSKLVVLDADTPQAMELLDSIEILSKTTQVKTRKGKHYYIRIRDWQEGKEYRSVRIVNEEKNIRVDAQVNRAYVVAPPSVINGHEYVFINGLDQLQELTMDEFQALLKEISKVVKGDNDKKIKKERKHAVAKPDIDNVRTGLEGDSFEPFKQYILTEYKVGKRHNICLGIAGTLRKMGLDKDITLSIVIDIAKRANDEELEDRILCVETTYAQDIYKVAGIKWLRKLGYDRYKLKALLDEAMRTFQATQTPQLNP